ncbi:hypothetical protein [Vandammella animalimorsus]|uniref:hypothetical protein n=1 Tax=Vandammella animalimorsus TaxID=2029117 RepID=UPI0011778671|nr:hypothetical protein [Vandammella animalimorsus]
MKLFFLAFLLLLSGCTLNRLDASQEACRVKSTDKESSPKNPKNHSRNAIKLNDVDAEELLALKISTEKFFKSNNTSDTWDINDCHYQKSGNKYYASCGRKGFDKSAWTGMHDIFMIFDEKFNLIETN